MKFSSSALALGVLQASFLASSAFHVQPAQVKSVGPLSAFSYGDGESSQRGYNTALQSSNVSDKTVPGVGQMSGGSMAPSSATQAGDAQLSKSIWDTLAPILVQGDSLRTWSFTTPAIERVQVLMKTDGRPLHADIDLWQGPDNTPQKMSVYIEDGDLRPFSCVIETPAGYNAIAIRNTGRLEFPLSACVEADLATSNGMGSTGLGAVTKRLADMSVPQTVQGGAIKTYPFDSSVASVQILLKTDGRPLNCRIELLQGPNNKKQVMEIYTEDGLERPFFAVVETPGPGNVIRVCNTATMEYPLTACVEPYLVEANSSPFTISEGESNSLFFLDP